MLEEKTLKIRHKIVNLIAPKLYVEYQSEREFKVQRASVPRPMIVFLQQYFGDRPLTGVEIGVAKGVNAENIIETLNIEKIFLVDPYAAYIGIDGMLITNYLNDYHLAQDRLSRFKAQTTRIKMTSTDACSEIPDNLDFVYIDGNHSYNNVKEDIENYYPKLKQDGILGGHDFTIHFPDVRKAVTEFVNEYNLRIHVERTDWWVTNPRLPYVRL